MKLIERPDFDQWVIATAQAKGLPEAFVEKDYFVTEILRTIVLAHPGAVVFKGGTSLSKGWRLLARFSEDLDILVRPEVMSPPWTTASRMTNGLRDLCVTVSGLPGLTPDPSRVQVSRPKRRAQFMSYAPRFSDLPGIEAGILFEPGVGAGDWPTVIRPITALVAETIQSQGLAATVATDDLEAFDVETLALSRTFVEKLFIVHAAVERHRSGEEPIGRAARHFADLAVLAEQPEIEALLNSAEYREIVTDVDRASRDWYGARHRPPADLNFAASLVFLPDDASEAVSRAYRSECDRLFFGRAYPSLSEVQDRLLGVRHLL